MAPGQSFIINLRKDKFEDIRVRKAIGLMFNLNGQQNTFMIYTQDKFILGKQ